MRIDVLCTDPEHPVVPTLATWVARQAAWHDARLIHDKSDFRDGDILFLVSCSQIIRATERAAYRHTMVLHASDLPEGRGWSPHIWDILAGKNELTLSLLVAEDAVDSGSIWAKRRFALPRHALYEEINAALFRAEADLMTHAIDLVKAGDRPVPQDGRLPSYHPRRSPADSEVNPEKPLTELFNQLRVADPDRFPAFFRLHGCVYEICIRKRDRD